MMTLILSRSGALVQESSPTASLPQVTMVVVGLQVEVHPSVQVEAAIALLTPNAARTREVTETRTDQGDLKTSTEVCELCPSKKTTVRFLSRCTKSSLERP